MILQMFTLVAALTAAGAGFKNSRSIHTLRDEMHVLFTGKNRQEGPLAAQTTADRISAERRARPAKIRQFTS
jgi:hypothetical protein